MSLRVGVNLCWLVPGVVGGSEESTTRTLKALGHVAPDIELELFGLPSLADAHPELTTRHPFHALPIPGNSKLLRVVGEYVWLSAAARRRGLDVVHHAGGTAPGLVGRPLVLTVHDIQPLDLPENFHPLKVAYLRRALPSALAKATRITVPSSFVRDRLVSRLGVAASTVHVVPWSVPPWTDDDGVDPPRPDLPDRFLLLPAITYPHKRHELAIEALARLGPDFDDVVLVLTGGRGPADAAVVAAIERLGVGARVVRAGRVAEADMHWYFRHAAALVFPSVYEGFGVPVLEAMHVGCPAVVAAAGALPEVVGDGGVIVPGDDPADWAAAIERTLRGDRPGLVAAGSARARHFTAEASARALADAYRSAAYRNGGSGQ